MSSVSDVYREWDAAYVLGALSATERHEFEEHLAGCSYCQAAVAELAAMPGLLAQVPPGEGVTLPDPPSRSDPDARSAGPLHRGSPKRRQRVLVAAAIVAFLLAGGVGGYAAGDGLFPWQTSTANSAAAARRLAFSPVAPSSLTAVVDVVPQPQGTELRVECQYGTAGGGDLAAEPEGAYAAYAIYVIDRHGTATNAKEWTAKPDRVMHPTAATPLRVSQISAVEIRTVESGQTLMKAVVN